MNAPDETAELRAAIALLDRFVDDAAIDRRTRVYASSVRDVRTMLALVVTRIDEDRAKETP